VAVAPVVVVVLVTVVAVVVVLAVSELPPLAFPIKQPMAASDRSRAIWTGRSDALHVCQPAASASRAAFWPHSMDWAKYSSSNKK
jgi:hypothetical protein